MSWTALRRRRVSSSSPPCAVIVWGSWGPYHRARLREAQAAAAAKGVHVCGVEVYAESGVYPWPRASAAHLTTFGLRPPETQFRPLRTVCAAIKYFGRHRPDVVFLPSYIPWSLVLNLVARCFGARTVMMNDTHRGTTMQGRLRMALKRRIIPTFDAALVAGTPQVEFFAEMGIKRDRIYLGHGVVDNAHFQSVADQTRAADACVRLDLGLPSRYFLSLGRLVPKKNVALVLRAYNRIAKLDPGCPPLVVVGEGPELKSLVALAESLDLPWTSRHGTPRSFIGESPGVHFLPYASYDDVPKFYALCTAFVLASTEDEWGLVVNEAMAAGAPVIVSDSVGCVRDLCTDRVTALVFRSEDIDSLVAALLLVSQSQVSALICSGARQRIKAWDVCTFGIGCMAIIDQIQMDRGISGDVVDDSV